MKKYFSVTLIACIALSIYSCKKTELIPPPAKSYSCKVNGTEFPTDNNALVSIHNNGRTLITRNFDLFEVSIEIPKQDTGKYMIDGVEGKGFYKMPYPYSSESLLCNFNQNGLIEVTKYDRVNHQISGRFYFSCQGIDENGDTVTTVVTEGKLFNLTY